MTLSFVSGVDEIGKRSRKQRKADREQKRDKRKEGRKGKGSKVAKIALAPCRAAFLAIVSLNVFGIATKLNTISKDKVSKFWQKFKGKDKNIFEAINKGKARKESKANGIGAVTAAAAIATATPILVALVAFFKENRVPTEDLESGVDMGKEFLLEDPETEKGTTDEYLPPDKVGVSKGDKKPLLDTTKPDPDTEEESNTKPLLIVGAAAAALLLLSK